MRATVHAVTVASMVALSTLSVEGAAQSDTTAGQAGAAGRVSDSTTALPQAPGDARVGSDTIGFGGRVIQAGDSVQGPVVVALGDLRVRGTVIGTAVVIAGDLIVEDGGRVTGDAIAAFGAVRAPSGAVAGVQRSISATLGSRLGLTPARRAARLSTQGALNLSLGWLVIVLLIGIGVHAFAGDYLAGVTDVLEQSFWRSFLVGVAGELGIGPVLALLLIALTVTVVGILLIPFAVVAYLLAVAGLVTLGFLAMARLTGGSMGPGRSKRLSAGGSALRGLVLGILLYLGMWVAAALLQWSPLLSGVARVLALAITYVAATAGLGAAILSRAGTRRDAVRPRAASDEMAVWLTPTPVTGVVAARRPTPAATSRHRV